MASKRRLRRTGKLDSEKAIAQRLHARGRVWSRLGVEFSKEDARGVVSAIQHNKAKFVDRQSNRVTRWAIDIHGIPCVCVYDNKTKEVVTVLTNEMVSPSLGEQGGQP